MSFFLGEEGEEEGGMSFSLWEPCFLGVEGVSLFFVGREGGEEGGLSCLFFCSVFWEVSVSFFLWCLLFFW